MQCLRTLSACSARSSRVRGRLDGRFRVIVHFDRASSRIVGRSVSSSENEDVTAAATVHMCGTNGIPDLVVTDNGSAFNSRRIADGLQPRYRTKPQRAIDWNLLGVLNIYNIQLQNTAPGRPLGKLSSSIFSVLRHMDNAPVSIVRDAPARPTRRTPIRCQYCWTCSRR